MMKTLLFACIFSICSYYTFATTYYISPSGDPGNSGLSWTEARSDFQDVLDDLRANDTLMVDDGVYFQYNRRFDLDDDVVMLARNRGRAIITGAWPEAYLGTVQWEAVGDGIYRAPQRTSGGNTVSSKMGGYEGNFLMEYKTLDDLQSGTIFASGMSPQNMNIPDYGFAHENDFCYLRLPNGIDPNGKKIIIAGKSPVLWVSKSKGLVMDGFKIIGSGDVGVKRYDDWGSTHAVFRNCIFEYCRSAVRLDSYSLVEWCEHSFPGFKKYADDLKALNPQAIENDKLINLIFQIVKKYDGADLEGHMAYQVDNKGSIPDGAASNCEFRYNYIHEVFDGNRLGDFNYSESHHNVYEHCFDNAEELEGTAKNHSIGQEMHHNLIIGSNYGAISHQQDNENNLSVKGPHFVHHNVIYYYDDLGANTWTAIKTRMFDNDTIHYYHNLIWYKRRGLYWDQSEATGTPRMNWKNNLIVFEDQLNDYSTVPFEADYNALVYKNSMGGIQGPNGLHFTDPSSIQFSDVSSLDFTLQSGSPLIDQGVEIPGYNDDFKGDAPDIGPFEYGETIPEEWPRPRRTVFSDYKNVVACTEYLAKNLDLSTGSVASMTIAAEGSAYYLDRAYTLKSLPQDLEGATLIQLFNDEKEETNEAYLTFTTCEPATVYLAYDSRASTIPQWLEEWTRQPGSVVTNEFEGSELSFDLYAKNFTDIVSIGGNISSGASASDNPSQFMVFVAPQTDIITGSFAGSKSTSFAVYPNPANDRIFINDVQSADIYMADGHLVRSVKSVSGKGIDISSLPKGLYIVKDKEAGKVGRFIKF